VASDSATNGSPDANSGVELLSTDQPLARPEDDRLGYAPFARALAEGIVSLTPSSGYVMALYGAWGSGKTTVLNFVRFYLEREASKPVLVDFNPWLFSGQEELTTRFLEQLLTVVEPTGWNRRKRRKVRSTFATFAEYVSEAPSLIGTGGRLAAKALRVDAPVIHDLKNELQKYLSERASRIVVLVDDTDRLTHDQIRNLFRLIKAVADFENVTYVVALDQKVAQDALRDHFGERAAEYIDKIVQLPHELPLPNRIALRGMLSEKLDALLNSSDTSEELDRGYWSETYNKAIHPFLRTPRDASRLVNVLQATYLPVADEVNFADFVALATLRVFNRGVWDVVRRNPDAFAGTTSTDSRAFDHEQASLTQLYDGMLASKSDESRRAIDQALAQVFPKYAGARGGMRHGSDWARAWLQERRAASPSVFPLYFQQAPPPGVLSRAEVGRILSTVCDGAAFRDELLALADARESSGRSSLPGYLELLRDYAEDLPEECVSSGVRVFFDIGDLLMLEGDEGPGILGERNDIRMMQILYRWLRRVPPEARFALLEGAISEGDAVSFAAHEVGVYAQEQGEMGASGRHESDWTVAPDELEVLKQLIVEKIESLAQDGSLRPRPAF
jgi:predicted KAP-like P-loop ATPase